MMKTPVYEIHKVDLVAYHTVWSHAQPTSASIVMLRFRLRPIYKVTAAVVYVRERII